MDIRAAKDRAHRLYASGRYSRAAEAYAALVAQSPRDALLRLRLADAARRSNNALQAVGAYRAAARLLVDSGHEARARAALKLALELAPGHPEIERALEALDGDRSGGLAEAMARAAEAQPAIAIEVEAPEPLLQGAVVELPAPDASSAVSTMKEYHRIDPHTVAFRKPDGDGWWVVHSTAPVTLQEIQVEVESELETFEEVDVG